jgi:preprotein translocase subunit SecD
MLHIPLWKRVLIFGLCALGLLTAAPNLFYSRVEAHNDAIAAAEKAGFETPEQAAARAGWPDWLPSGLVNLGLDLRGGAHLLAEVNVAEVYKARMDDLWPELRKALAAERAARRGRRMSCMCRSAHRIRWRKPSRLPKPSPRPWSP